MLNRVRVGPQHVGRMPAGVNMTAFERSLWIPDEQSGEFRSSSIAAHLAPTIAEQSATIAPV